MFHKVDEFEKRIAEFFGAPRAVATDSCTHAIELCLRFNSVVSATCPTRTYLSIPMTLEKLNIKWNWEEKIWKDYYFLGNTNIYDAAVLWRRNSYRADTFMCLSFQYQKHLSLGRGGAILCNDIDWLELKKMSYDGREPGVPWKTQNVTTLGYHYYMTPETAELGLQKLPDAIQSEPKTWTDKDYPYLPNMRVFI